MFFEAQEHSELCPHLGVLSLLLVIETQIAGWLRLCSHEFSLSLIPCFAQHLVLLLKNESSCINKEMIY